MGDRRQWSYSQVVDALEEELTALDALVASLTPEDFERSTRLRVSPESEPWSVKDLMAHNHISIHMLPDLTAAPADGQPELDRVGFFINDPKVVAPIVDQYARALAAEHTAETMRALFSQTVRDTVEAARSNDPTIVGPGFFGPMRLDEFAQTRVVEAVVHGHDVSEAVGRAPLLTPAARAITVQLLEELLERRKGGTRPADLEDDLDFIEVATGRRAHADPRFPVLG